MTDPFAITGISGRFPNCTNVQELQNALFSDHSLISREHDRWNSDSLECAPAMGLMKDYHQFDPSFFGINPKEADNFDPRARKMLETTFEAMLDAGLNPSELRGSKGGVFVGLSPTEIADVDYRGGLLHRHTALIANEVSYYFDLKGPSMALSTVCSSALYALTLAVDSISCGRCDYAVLIAAQLHVDPSETIELSGYGVLAPKGQSTPLNATRSGYIKSEAVVTIIVQKTKDSRRIYGTIAGTGLYTEAYKPEGLAHPLSQQQRKFFEEVFEKYNLDPLDVGYVETHATGTVVGDCEEIQAIDEFFTRGRQSPLMIGSAKGRLGHCETASGFVSLVKVIIALREGRVPSDVGFERPDPKMRGIIEGRLKVVTETTDLPSGLIVVNAFGFGCAHSMLVLRPFLKRCQPTPLKSLHLVHTSGRSEEAVQTLLDAIVQHQNNPDFLSLLNHIHHRPIDNHTHRGFALLSATNAPKFTIEKCDSTKRPIWFVYSGFGSQWPKMGKDLMRLEAFRTTIQKCHQALEPFGIDLEDLIMNGVEEDFNDLIKTFTGITAISVALTKTLSVFNIKPDGIIGHSLGEIGCAYGDGLITEEEAMRLSYSRAYSVMNANVIKGSLAAVGLSEEACSKLLPKDIYIACDNSEDSVTIAGPVKEIQLFAKDLQEAGIFVRILPNSSYPFHCAHLAPADKQMLAFTKSVFTKIVPRSNKWLSSTFPENEWCTQKAKSISPEYYHHNLLNPVRFRQVIKYIPEDAIVVELGPRALLRSILKKCLPSTVTFVSFAEPKVDNFEFFLTNLGRFYNSGGNLDLRLFYKSVDFPVGVDTPILSNFIKWNYQQKWHTLKYNPRGCFGGKIVIDINQPEYQFLKAHKIDDQFILPGAGHMLLVWKTFAKMLEKHYTKLPIVIENLETLRPTMFFNERTTSIIVNIFQSTGLFEISLGNDLNIPLATGKIKTVDDVDNEFLDYSNIPKTDLTMSQEDFYYFLQLKGYHFEGDFLSVLNCDIDGTRAKVKWDKNWLTFIDSLIQFSLGINGTPHSHPNFFKKIVINPFEQLKTIMDVVHDKNRGGVKSGGVEIRGIMTNVVPRRITESSVLKKYEFVPNLEPESSFEHSVTVAAQIVIENSGKDLKIAEFESNDAISILKTTIERPHLKAIEFVQIPTLDSHFDLIFVNHECDDEFLLACLKQAKFVFTKLGNGLGGEIVYQNPEFVLYKSTSFVPETYEIIETENENYEWIDTLKTAVSNLNPNGRIYLVNKSPDSGLMGLFNTLRFEQFCDNLRIFFVRNCAKFSLDSKFFLEQVRKDLTINVFDECWGTYRILPLEPEKLQLCSEAKLVKDQWIQQSSFQPKIKIAFAELALDDGFQYSGLDSSGKKVMGVSNGTISNSVQPHLFLTWQCDGFKMEEAATIPLPLTLLYYGLFIRNNLSQTHSILVHNPSSNFSRAALALAQTTNCRVFVVAQNQSHLDSIEQSFNLKNEDLILDQAAKPFFQTILAKTNNKGVDFVINSQSEQLLKVSQRCSKKTTVFLEFQKEIDVEHLNIDLNQILLETEEVLKKLSQGIKDFLQNGTVSQVVPQTFAATEIETALNHNAPVLISMQSKILAKPRTYFNPDKVYIIIGGLGGLGFELAKWMLNKGAAKIILNSRNGPKSGYQHHYLKKWERNGKTVVINTSNTSTLQGAENLLSFALKIAPIGGIFNLAIHVADNYITKLTSEDFLLAAKSKIISAKNLDEAAKQIDLDYFVFFSSFGSSVGSIMQSAYSYMNSAGERLCERRRREGRHGLAIQFGPIADVGALSKSKLQYLMEIRTQSHYACLEALDQFMQREESVLIVYEFTEMVEEEEEERTLAHSVANVLGFKNLDDVDMKKSFVDLGIDSILGFVLGNLILSETGVELSVHEIRNLTFKQIVEMT